MIRENFDDIQKNAYREENRSIARRRSIIGCVLTLILMPAGSLLDLYVYPEYFSAFLRVRVIVDFIVLLILGLHFSDKGRKYIKELIMCWIMLLNISFCWMIYSTQGALSPYYAALNMVLLAGALLPWTLYETLFASLTTLIIYIITCYIYGGLAGVRDNWDIFFNNIYFIILTGILCTTYNYFSENARFQDFLLRHELDIKNKKLEGIDRLKSQFFANVSHELRTPLTLILSPTNNLLAKGENLPAHVHESLLVVQKNALRLLKLINELLDVIRLEEKSMLLEKETIDLSSFVSGIANSVRHLVISKGLVMTVKQPTEQILVYADPNRLEKVLLNLLSNAIKFTPAGGNIDITIVKEGKDAVVRVSDTGIGISNDQLPFIFDRFHQVVQNANRTSHGVGIGLSLARDLIERQGGELRVESEKGRGTSFVIYLPCLTKPVSSSEIITKPIEAKEGEPFAAAFKSADRLFIPTNAFSNKDVLPSIGKGDHTILVVDDEPDMLRFLVSILSCDYRVLQATDGEGALMLTQKEHPHLILLDWMLPCISGLDACRKIREMSKDIKIILLTARVDEASKINALKEGADDFLTKPFSTVEIRTRIANLINVGKLQRDLKKRNMELKDMLSKLKETESQLVQSEKMNAIGTLSAGLLHEINNPLNFSLTAVEVGRRLAHGQYELKEVLDDIEDGMKRISTIISDLRTFAYPERADNMAPFRLIDVIASAMRLVAHEILNVKVIKELDHDIIIHGSQTQITHILTNLLVNAGKALREKSDPLIKISGQCIDGRYRLTVFDNGKGITPDIIDKIFEPFFTTADVGKGMGLGLSICYTIVSNHGGKITAKSREKEWTEISFDLPIIHKSNNNEKGESKNVRDYSLCG